MLSIVGVWDRGPLPASNNKPADAIPFPGTLYIIFKGRDAGDVFNAPSLYPQPPRQLVNSGFGIE